jgi:hypothetical protein
VKKCPCDVIDASKIKFFTLSRKEKLKGKNLLIQIYIIHTLETKTRITRIEDFMGRKTILKEEYLIKETI